MNITQYCKLADIDTSELYGTESVFQSDMESLDLPEDAKNG